jgi:dTMP kinase
MPQLKQGLLISVEGIDGSGKSTLAKNLYTMFLQHGYAVVKTQEPGGTPFGLKIRELIQNNAMPHCSKAQYLLFAADRAQHFEQVIIPNLALNKLIISDRLSDSSLAYQSYGNNLSIKHIQDINQWTMNNITPNLTIYVRVPVTIALERVIKRNQEISVFEKKEFLEKVFYGFEMIYKNRTDVMIVDGTQDQESIAAETYINIEQWLQKDYL